MQTILILLDPGKLANPDLDLRYRLPERIQQETAGAVQENGYDFLDCEQGGPLLALWLKTPAAQEQVPVVIRLMQREQILGNDLVQSAEIYISTEDCAALESCTRVFPQETA